MKASLSRRKVEPIASTVPTLVGKNVFSCAGKWPWQWEPTPLLAYLSTPFAARSAAVGDSCRTLVEQRQYGKRGLLAMMKLR